MTRRTENEKSKGAQLVNSFCGGGIPSKEPFGEQQRKEGFQSWLYSGWEGMVAATCVCNLKNLQVRMQKDRFNEQLQEDIIANLPTSVGPWVLYRQRREIELLQSQRLSLSVEASDP